MAYGKGLICYSNALDVNGPNTTADWAFLPQYDRLIIGEGTYAASNGGLVEHTPDAPGNLTTAQISHIEAIALKYFDPYWRDAATGGVWFFGPGDSEAGSQSDITIDGKHTFQMTNRHMERLFGWVEAALLDNTYPCNGVFLDDYGFGDSSGGGANAPLVWGAHDGLPGYPTTDWNQARAVLLAQRVIALENSINKYALFNNHYDLTGSLGERRMFEGYMYYYNRAHLQATARPGDWIVVRGRDLIANDTLDWYEITSGDVELNYGAEIGDTYAPGGTNSIMDQAIEDAEALGLTVAVCLNPQGSYGLHTYNGASFGSSAALIDDPAEWE